MNPGRQTSRAIVPAFLLAVVFSTAISLHAQQSSQAVAPLYAEAGPANTSSNSGAGSQTNSPNGPVHSNNAVRLGAGDLLDVSVYGVSDLATKTRVSNDGDIYLPLVDYVHVAGLTQDEAQTVIEKRYIAGKFLVDPHVSVFIDEYASQGVNVLGAVNRPGVYPVLGKQRVLDIVAAAGGLSEKAGQTATLSHKEQPDETTTIALRGNAKGESSTIEVEPGDTLMVQAADVVYVVGDVARPSGLLMDGGSLTVLQAIAMVGGTTRTSKLSGVKILHKNNTGITETVVPLKKILQAKAPDVPMQANDILFVPSSAAKAAAARSVDTIVQTASALTLVAARP